MRRLMFLLPLFGACSHAVADSESPTVAPLVATTSVTPATFRAGDNVTVVVTVLNRGETSQSIQINQCDRAFVVTTPSGDVVGPDDEGCLLYSEFHALAPGAQYIWSSQWAGRGSTTAGVPTLAPGTYMVAGAPTIPFPYPGEAMAQLPASIQITP
jgi:hypothetical protein